MSSMHPIISSLINNWKNDENRRFHRLFIGILSVCIILIIFANVNQLRKKSIHCKYPSIHLKGSLLGKRRGPPYLTYIISNLPKRLNLTRTSLISRIPFYFNIHHRQPVPHDDLRIRQHGDMNMSSLLLTYVDLWSEFGWKKTDEYNDNDWIFIFEDDVDIVPREIIEKFYGINQTLNSPSLLTNIIENGLELAKNDGLLYLGTCQPNYTDSIQHLIDGITEYRHGVYYCTHAMAYTKWRVRTLWGDYATSRFLHNEFSIERIARLWQIFSKTYPLSIGTNIEYPQGKNQFGFFFQNRDRFNSTVEVQ